MASEALFLGLSAGVFPAGLACESGTEGVLPSMCMGTALRLEMWEGHGGSGALSPLCFLPRARQVFFCPCMPARSLHTVQPLAVSGCTYLWQQMPSSLTFRQGLQQQLPGGAQVFFRLGAAYSLASTVVSLPAVFLACRWPIVGVCHFTIM